MYLFAFKLVQPIMLFSHSAMSDSPTPWNAEPQVSLSFTTSQSLLRFMSIELVMAFSHLMLCWPLLLLPSIFPRIRVFSNELALCIRWPKYLSFNFSISLSDEYSGLISFRIDLFDLLAEGTLKSLLQHPSQFKSINSLVLSPCANGFIFPFWKRGGNDE